MESKRILVIDDDLDLRQVLVAALESHGYAVAAASNGREGLAALKAQDVDLVITDIVMPEMEGIETIFQIISKNPHQKLIAMSGGGRISAREYLEDANLLGATATLPKPFTLSELLDLVESILD